MTTFTLSTPDVYFVHFPMWDKEVTFRRAYRTSILKTITGKEQRNSLRTIVLKSLSFEVIPSSIAEVNYMRRYLMAYLHSLWGVPVWPREMALSAAAASGQNILSITDTRYRGLANGNVVIVVDDYETYDVGTIDSFTNTQINLVANLANSYTTRHKVYPVLNAQLDSPQKLSRLIPGYSRVGMEFVEPLRSEEA